MEREGEPRLQGVVIISLPPPDDPSKGKTITAFTLSDPSPQPPHHPTQHALPVRSRPPLRSRFPLSPKKAGASLLAAALIAFSLWLCLSSEAPYQLLGGSEEDPRRRSDSFLLPLYPKNRTSAVVPEVKLGTMKIVKGVRTKRGQSAKLGVSSSTNSPAVLSIKGNVFPDGQYYTSILVGNPPRPFFLDVDTGSDLTWIQCDAPCTSCAKGPHQLYSPTKEKIVPSSDYLCLELQGNQNYANCKSCHQCDYEIEYADHSSSMGVLARDDVNLFTTNGDRVKFSFAFGCAYDQQGQLSVSPAKTDGILGLSGAKVSLPSQLASQGITTNVVGHCITNGAHDGGYMFFGDDFVPHWGMTWVPTLSGFLSLYSVEVRKITYGGQQLHWGKQEGNAGQVVFDSGSSYTYFTNDAYSQLINSLKNVARVLVQDDSDPALRVCWKADSPIRSLKDVRQFFEPLTLQFAKRWWEIPKIFILPPEGYLLINNKGNVCLGILNGTEVYDGSTIILGDISLRGKLVVYDNVQQKVGWTQSDCAKPQRPKDFPFFF